MQGEDNGQCAPLPSKVRIHIRNEHALCLGNSQMQVPSTSIVARCTIAIAILREDKRIFDKFMGSGQEHGSLSTAISPKSFRCSKNWFVSICCKLAADLKTCKRGLWIGWAGWLAACCSAFFLKSIV